MFTKYYETLSLCKLLIHVSRRKLAEKYRVKLKVRTLRSRQRNVVWVLCSWRRDHKLPSPKLLVIAYIFNCLCAEYFIQVCYILKLRQVLGITGQNNYSPFFWWGFILGGGTEIQPTIIQQNTCSQIKINVFTNIQTKRKKVTCKTTKYDAVSVLGEQKAFNYWE